MIIEIRDDDCYPCTNPIIRLEKISSNLMHVDYPKSRTIEELKNAQRYCEIILDILSDEIEVLRDA